MDILKDTMIRILKKCTLMKNEEEKLFWLPRNTLYLYIFNLIDFRELSVNKANKAALTEKTTKQHFKNVKTTVMNSSP